MSDEALGQLAAMRKGNITKQQYDVEKKLLDSTDVWSKSTQPRYYKEFAPDLYPSAGLLRQAPSPREQKAAQDLMSAE